MAVALLDLFDHLRSPASCSRTVRSSYPDVFLFTPLRYPRRPYTFKFAFSLHGTCIVENEIRVLIGSLHIYPLLLRIPSSFSESLAFIWHPNVFDKTGERTSFFRALRLHELFHLFHKVLLPRRFLRRSPCDDIFICHILSFLQRALTLSVKLTSHFLENRPAGD